MIFGYVLEQVISWVGVIGLYMHKGGVLGVFLTKVIYTGIRVFFLA